MRQLAILTIAAAALGACGAAGHAEEHDSGPQVSRSYQVPAFSRIEVAGPFDVAVTTGGAPLAAASGSEKLLDETEVLVKGDTLIIRPKKRNGFSWPWRGSNGKAVFTVSTAMLKGAGVAGSGDITIDRVEGDFDGEVAGSGGIVVGALKGGRADFQIAGSGSIRAAGSAERVGIEIAGSGDVDTTALAAREAKVEIAGSGNVRAKASDTAAVSIAGSGDVEISGGAKCSVDKAGSGDVRCS